MSEDLFRLEDGDQRLDIVEFVRVCQAIGTDAVALLKTSGLVRPRGR